MASRRKVVVKSNASAATCELANSAAALNGCPHTKEYKTQEGLQAFQTLQKYIQSLRHIAPVVSLPVPQCSACGHLGTHLYACLECVTIGCFGPYLGDPTGDHMTPHHVIKGHRLGLDLSGNQVFCFTCGQHVYDTDLDAIVQQEKARAIATALDVTDPNEARIVYTPWVGSKREGELLQSNAKRQKLTHVTGLRGLNNLGNTCFMNCILQAFVHNPLLRSYFLGLHPSRGCAISAEGNPCLGCELDKLFAQMFTVDEHRPLTPHKFLATMWNHADHLAGYEQQDAHEFLISALNGVHMHCDGAASGRCTCVIHRIFSGTLRSDVTCFNCGNTSSSHEPFFDISLDVRKRTDPVTPGALEYGLSFDEDKLSLLDCLRSFTKEEKLGAEQKIMCSKCGTNQESSKQLSLADMPMVLCLHMKRFEHSFTPTKKVSTKINTIVRFPTRLDMAPYLSTSILRRKKTHGGASAAAPPPMGAAALLASPVEYDLFAVVNHTGSMDTGHYTNYVRHSTGVGQTADAWFKCDDGYITPAGVDDVLDSQGYLLFYTKRSIDYETNVEERVL